MINKVVLVGRVGKDPELNNVAGDKTVAKFSLATGNKDYTQWHYVEAWNKTADICNLYVKKGSLLYVEGEIRYTESKEGKKYTSITAFLVRVLDKKSDGADSVRMEAVMGSETVDTMPF